MKFTTRCFTFCLMLMSVCFCEPIAADVVLGFSDDDGGSFADSFDVRTGESLVISIYLRQTDADTVLTDEGIVLWGFDLTRASTSFGSISNPVINPVFDTENHNVTTETGFEWEYIEAASTGIRGNNVLLGSFQFDTSAEGATVFSIEDRLVGTGVDNANWLTSSGNFLDQQIFGAGAADTFQFSVNSVSAVPEPSSLIMLGGLTGLMIGRRRRIA